MTKAFKYLPATTSTNIFTIPKIIQKHHKIFPLLILSLLLLGRCAYAQDRGFDIMKKNDNLKEPSDAYADGTMVLVNKNGNKKQRKMKMYSRKAENGYDTFFEITAPADVEGTRFLTLARKGDDEQRIYLPALGKSRKISGSGKDGKFLGSDIYFYDLEDHALDEFTYKFIKEDTWENHDYFVVEAYPKSKDAPYSKIVNWVRQDDYYIYKIEMYGKQQNRHVKTLITAETTTIQGIIEPTKMVVYNHLENHKTFFIQQNHRVNVGLDENIFTVQNLEQ